METIEERANDYGMVRKHPFIVRTISQAYNDGAADQKKIDIEETCEWLSKNLKEYFIQSTRTIVGEAKSRQEIINDIINDFRKAMEE